MTRDQLRAAIWGGIAAIPEIQPVEYQNQPRAFGEDEDNYVSVAIEDLGPVRIGFGRGKRVLSGNLVVRLYAPAEGMASLNERVEALDNAIVGSTIAGVQFFDSRTTADGATPQGNLAVVLFVCPFRATVTES